MKAIFALLSKNFGEKDLDRRKSDVRKKFRRARFRQTRGNMIAFISAVTLGLVLAILFFALKYTRMLGSNQEQRTAIEGAALQVANDISRIVYEDDNFGFIALSNFAPIGYNTVARDGQPTPVRGINTILGTVRLDMIIADAMGNSEMQTLAANDYQNAITAVHNLQAQLTDACSPNPQDVHRDWDGNPVNVYQDAVAAYNQNIIRMSGNHTALDPQSVQITLGVLKNGASTNTPIPQPANFSNVAAAQTKVQTFPNNQQVTCYKSYINIPYGGGIAAKPFVFCGVDNSLKLVDINQFSTDISGLPFALTSIVKVEGDQVFQGDNNTASSSRVHSVACAQPASAGDPRPFPGAMTIGFPNGQMPEIASPGDILTKPGIAKIPMTIKTSNSGDVGNDPIVPALTYPTLGTVGSIGGYHFIRRAGTKPNVQSVVNSYATAFSSIPVTGGAGPGLLYIYSFDANGNVVPTAQKQAPARQMMQSQHQLIGKSLVGVTSSNSKTYGATFSDLVAIPGSKYGGKHAGEPLLGAGQPANWDGTSSGSGVGILAIGGILGALLTVLVFPLLSLLATITSLILGIPPATAAWPADAVRPPNIVVPGNAATTRTPRDTYTSQGLAVDMEIPQITPGLF